jgi:hypothetical protein
MDQNVIYTKMQNLIPGDLWNKYSHLSFREMAGVDELEPWRDELNRAENDWFDSDEEGDDFEEIDCSCGKSFTKMEKGDVQCPYCGQIWGS